MESETFWRWFDRGARVDFAATIVNWFFDWKTYALGAVGAIVGAILPKLDNWSSTAIFLVMLAAFAVVALLYLAFCVLLDRRASNRKGERPAAIEAPAVIPRAEVQEVELVPDTDPRELYFQILKDSDWKRAELRKTTDTTHLRGDWLDIRLSEQIHEALLNSKLASRGKECLQGTETTPEHGFVEMQCLSKERRSRDSTCKPGSCKGAECRGRQKTIWEPPMSCYRPLKTESLTFFFTLALADSANDLLIRFST
jgi:hypothetical protein